MTDFKTLIKKYPSTHMYFFESVHIYHTIIMSYHRQCSSESGGSSLLFKSTIFLNFLFKISTESYRKTIGSCPFTFKHDDACQYQSTFPTKKRNTHKQIKAGIKEHHRVV